MFDMPISYDDKGRRPKVFWSFLHIQNDCLRRGSNGFEVFVYFFETHRKENDRCPVYFKALGSKQAWSLREICPLRPVTDNFDA